MGEDEARAFFGRDFDNWMQAQRLQAQLEDRALSKFSLCLNLGDIRPENVQMSITDRVVTVSGYQKELAEDQDGMIRETFHGFSNEFGLPEDVDPNTVVVRSNPDQSITIEADYFIPFDARLEAGVSPVVCQRPSSVPPALSQRDTALSRHDISNSPIHRSQHIPFSTSSPTINSSRKAFILDPALYDSPAAFGPNQMKAPHNDPGSSANNTSPMPPQFGIPQMKNLQSSMMYSEDNNFGLPPQYCSNERQVVQGAPGALPDDNAATFCQFNSSAALRQTLQTRLPPSEENSIDLQCQYNYSGLSNQALQSTLGPSPDNNPALFSPLPPAAQLSPCQMMALQQSQGSGADNNNDIRAQLSPCQMMALQQSQGSGADNNNDIRAQLSPCQIKARQQRQGSCADNSCGMSSPLSPCQRKALKNSHTAENSYSSAASAASTHHDTAFPLQHNYIGKPNSIEIPSCNACGTSNRPSQVNRALLKPGTRCEASPSYCPKYDYKIPGTRCPPSRQYHGEIGNGKQAQSFHNVSITKDAGSPGLTNTTW